MSAEAKPVEVLPQATETPVVEAPKPVETAPVVEPTIAEPTTTTTTEAPVVAEAPKEEVTEAVAVKEEVKPVEEGVLGYKGPGLLKSFIFQKKFFFFGTEPVEHKKLSSYLRGEKAQDTANKNAAWASHTGKGLLFFTKKANEKATPAGIFNLSDVSDITEEGTTDFHFTLAGHKHTFQASSIAERDNWVAVLKSKVAEAKELAPTVVESEEYKTAHTHLTKPAAVVAAATTPKKSVEKVEAAKEEKKEEKAEEKAEKAEEKKEIKEEKKEEKKSRQSRSASRKRNSIFGGFGKKTEEKKEVAPVTAEATPAPVPAVEEPVVAATEPVVAPEVVEPTPAVEATPAVAPVEARPTPSKRNSIFDTLKSQFSQHKEKKPETETAPAVPAKETEPVSETAPVIPAVQESEPLATSVAAPAAAPVETAEAPVTNGETKAVETPVVKTDKRKSSLPWLTKKEKATTSDDEAEKPKSPFAKLRATVKGKSSPKAEKISEKPAATEVVEPKTTETPVVSEPTPVVPQSTPQVSASA